VLVIVAVAVIAIAVAGSSCAGIEIPFPHVTVYAGVGKDRTAPEFRLRTTAEKDVPDGTRA
jgi:hypothetical protein